MILNTIKDKDLLQRKLREIIAGFLSLYKKVSSQQRRKLLTVIVPLFFLVISGLVFINSYVDRECRNTIVTFVEKELNRKIVIGDSSFGIMNIYLKDVVVYETIKGEKAFLTIKRISLRPDFLECLLTSQSVLSKVMVDEPQLSITLKEDGLFNIDELNGEVLVSLKDIVGYISHHQDVTIDKMEVRGGSVRFSNNDTNFPMQNILISNINGTLSDFIGLRKYTAEVALKLSYAEKESEITIKGGRKTTVSETAFDIHTASLDLQFLKDLFGKEYPLSNGSVGGDLRLQVNNDEKSFDLQGRIGVTNAQIKDFDAGFLPEVFYLSPKVNYDIDKAEVKIDKLVLAVPEAGEMTLRGNFLKGKETLREYAFSLESNNFDIAHYLRAVGNQLPAAEKVLLTSSIILAGSEKKSSVSISGSAQVKNSKGYVASGTAEVDYLLKKKYSNITISDLLLDKDGSKEPLLTLAKAVMKKVVHTSKKTSIGSLTLSSPALQLVKGRKKDLNVTEAIKSFLNFPSEKGKKKSVYPLYVNSLRVNEGKASYTDESDRRTQQHFRLAHVKLVSSGIAPNSKAKVQIDAKVVNPSREAYLFVDGNVNPFTLEAKNLKLRVNRLPLKDFSSIAQNLNNITIQDGDLDVFVKVDVDKETNYRSTLNFELYKLRVKLPPENEGKASLFLDTLKRDGDVIRISDIKLTGNIKNKEYDFSDFKTAVIKTSLTSAPVATTSAGVVLTTILAATAPIALPVTAAVLGGTAIYNMIQGENKTKLAKKR